SDRGSGNGQAFKDRIAAAWTSPVGFEPPPSSATTPHCTPSSHTSVAATATPDLSFSGSAVVVSLNTVVTLIGSAETIVVNASCTVVSQSSVPFQWDITFQPRGGLPGPSPPLAGTTTLTPSFTASQPGTFRVTLTGGGTASTVIIEVLEGVV